MSYRVGLLFVFLPSVAAAANVKVDIDWNAPTRTVSTAATIEVDHMPFLARVKEGGNFDGYYESLQNLDAAYVRFAPWYPYPRVAVTELYPADCSKDGAGSSFNSTLLDGVMADFMTAVCGPQAAKGECTNNHSVVPMITTMPAWMYEGGDDKMKDVPEDPWQFPSGGFSYYVMHNAKLKDPTCKQMARYAARMVEWYTKGGTTDECGKRHESGLYYNFWGVSVLNEDEYKTPPLHGIEYTICWDSWREEIAKINPKVVLVGPETVSDLGYSKYFINGSHHSDGRPPAVVANHMGMRGPPFSNFFTSLDSWMEGFAIPLDNARREVAPDTEMIMNEYIPFNSEWCADAGKAQSPKARSPGPDWTYSKSQAAHSQGNGCPDWTHSSSKGTKINRKTLGWNAAAASFAYGFGRMATLGYKYVGADQLVAGPWPDNEPAVASLDWDTGEPNAKYWAVRMLAAGLGSGLKTLYNSTVTKSGAPYPPGLQRIGNCGNTGYRDDCDNSPQGAWNTTEHKMTSLEDCVAKCRGCAMCNYVSFSLDAGHQDCSWYRSCDMDALAHIGDIYQSEAVNPGRAPPHVDIFAQPMEVKGTKVVLLVSKTEKPQSVQIAGGSNAVASVLEGVGDEPGFTPPTQRILSSEGVLTLNAYAVALVTLHGADTVVI